MAEGTQPLFTNWRTGQQLTIVSGIGTASVTNSQLAGPILSAIGTASVTNAMLADMAGFTIKARASSTTGTPEDATITQVLDFLSGGSSHGAIPYRDSATWAALAPGTAGLFLQTQGAGADPIWAAVGGGITLIASGSLSGTTVAITDIPDTYAYLVLQMTGVSSDTSIRQPRVRVSTNNGSTFDNTPGNYLGLNIAPTATTGTVETAVASVIESANQNNGENWTITICLFGYQTGPRHPYLAALEGSNSTRFTTHGAYIGSTDNIDALQMSWNGTGNFDAGDYWLYGVS